VQQFRDVGVEVTRVYDFEPAGTFVSAFVRAVKPR